MGMKARRDRLWADENLLAEWIGENFPAKKGASSVDQFAKLAGIAPSSVYSLCRGLHCPSLVLALRIAKLTKGAVPPESWVPEE